MKEIEMRIHPNPSHSDYVSYIKRDVLFPQILPNDSIIVNVEIDVAVETVTTTVDDLAAAVDIRVDICLSFDLLAYGFYKNMFVCLKVYYSCKSVG